MVDACTLAHPSDDEPALDETTGAYVPDDPSVYYTGSCRVKVANTQTNNPAAGEHEFSVRAAVVSVPIAVTGPLVDDVVTITASLYDPALVGRTYRVDGVLSQSFPTARRLACLELTA